MKNYPHDATPWRIGDAGHAVFGPKTDAISPKVIASDLTLGNADFICTTANAHDKLIDTLRFIRQTVHRAYHDGPHEECQKTICVTVDQTIAETEGRHAK